MRTLTIEQIATAYARHAEGQPLAEFTVYDPETMQSRPLTKDERHRVTRYLNRTAHRVNVIRAQQETAERRAQARDRARRRADARKLAAQRAHAAAAILRMAEVGR